MGSKSGGSPNIERHSSVFSAQRYAECGIATASRLSAYLSVCQRR